MPSSLIYRKRTAAWIRRQDVGCAKFGAISDTAGRSPRFRRPGRQLLYLVRDGAHPAHPVIGIACAEQLSSRNGREARAIHRLALRGYRRTIQRRRREGQGWRWKRRCGWLERQVETSLAEIDWTNLVTAEEVESPDDAVVRRLALRSQEFSKLRETLLREVAGSDEGSIRGRSLGRCSSASGR